MKHIHKKMKKKSWHLYLQCLLTGNNPGEYVNRHSYTGMLINIKITRIHATTWMDLRNITLSERSLTQKNSSNILYEALEHTKVICCSEGHCDHSKKMALGTWSKGNLGNVEPLSCHLWRECRQLKSKDFNDINT